MVDQHGGVHHVTSCRMDGVAYMFRLLPLLLPPPLSLGVCVQYQSGGMRLACHPIISASRGSSETNAELSCAPVWLQTSVVIFPAHVGGNTHLHHL